MNFNEITITEDEINDMLQQVSPGLPAFSGMDACEFYEENKRVIQAGIEILKNIYPLAGYGCAGLAVILEKYCKENTK